MQESTSTRSVPKKLGEGSDELDRSVFVKLMTGVQHVEFAIGNTPCHGRQFMALLTDLWVIPCRGGLVGGRRG